uniref:DUF155 domain-containing protein n=1 Tax=Aegilops tauschii subsp. strangulata TaxID=200361 RepID=A0A453FKN2_AEGTS
MEFGSFQVFLVKVSLLIITYGRVDDMVEEFTEINRIMEKTGDFTMKRKKLFQLVGKANSNLADVIIRLGLFDRHVL